MVCTICKQTLKVTYNECTTCNQYKLCIECFRNHGHIHEMKFIDHSQEPLLISYVRMLMQTYRNQEGNYDATVESLHAHVTTTRLMCNCIFCKKIYLVYNYHAKKCFTPGCCISRCPIVNEQFLKKRLAEFNCPDKQRKLLKGRLSKLDSTDPGTINSALARKFTIQRCIRTLVHACHCLEPDCMPLSCQKMKRILAHIKVCKRKIKGGCTICTQLSTLCCFHAKNCKESKCPVLLCSAYKRKLADSNKKAAVS